MKITIAERLHPFSHRAGTKFLLPGTSLIVEVFPTRLCFSDTERVLQPFVASPGFQGRLQGFTAGLDLERARLCVFGSTKEGFIRYFVSAKEEGIYLTMDRAPKASMEKISTGLLLCSSRGMLRGGSPEMRERLSLGIHRAQDWEMIRRRLDLKEILPHWLRLSALSPVVEPPSDRTKGNYPLLEICRQKIEQKERETVLDAFADLFLAALGGVLVPRYKDTDYQGIVGDCGETGGPVLPLLTEAGRYIRSLFIQESAEGLSLLPCLPSQLHCGRMIHIKTSKNLSLDLEWTKKFLRTVVLTSENNQEISLKFPKGIRSFRWNDGSRQIRTVLLDPARNAVLTLKEGKAAFLDRFES
jgi:hypothetical protein